MTKDDLEHFMRRVRGCELVVLADISTQTILCAHAIMKLGQERFDALCASAARIFDMQELATTARLITPTGQTLFWRASAGTPEVICALCSTGTDVGRFHSEARALLIAGAE